MSAEKKERLLAVQEKIRGACQKAGRDLGSVTLIAVSKTKPFSDIAEFAALGLRNFGENYVQEAQEKIAEARAAGLDLRWHLIGTLQSNKAKFVAGNFCLFHALESLSLAQKLDKAAQVAGVVQECLLEVNVDLETTKGGIAESQVPEVLNKLSGLANVQIRGLMCIPAPGGGRAPFHRLRELRDGLNQAGAYRAPLTELSMGMSADFEDAILEGSTLVRVGTTLFGERAKR